MGAARCGGEERDADREQEEHAEADRKVLSPCARDGGVERSALMLHKQPPSSELLDGTFARWGDRSGGAETGGLVASRSVASGRPRRTGEEHLAAGTKEPHRCVGTRRIDRRVWIRPVQDV